jgi:hypothetical protein
MMECLHGHTCTSQQHRGQVLRYSEDSNTYTLVANKQVRVWVSGVGVGGGCAVQEALVGGQGGLGWQQAAAKKGAEGLFGK